MPVSFNAKTRHQSRKLTQCGQKQIKLINFFNDYAKLV